MVSPGPQPVRYLLLLAPSANRVYADQAPRLAVAELAAFGASVLRTGPLEPSTTQLAGVTYVEFVAPAPLHEEDLALLARHSSAYALFAATGQHGELLRPVALPHWARYDDDLVTIPKYGGKTNEQFTQLLLNVTVLASRHAAQLGERRLVVLDPLCGRGTILNVALRYGYDVIGIESDRGHFEAYGAFLRTWLRRKRLKHQAETNPVRHHGKRVARRLTASLAPTKEAYRAGEVERITMFEADTLRARELLKPGSCDVIVTDSPYGVAHGSRGGEQQRPSRHPTELLAAALPGWVQLLRRGGALGLAFNTHVAPRAAVAQLLTDAGLHVVTGEPYQELSHWVDQGITRDVLVARKPDA